MTDTKKDIFISYRREGGRETAKHLYDILRNDNYSVAFDIDTLRSGLFDKNIYKIIDKCTDFIIILSIGSLERCKNEGDWVRLEIKYALKRGKNIIPIIMPNFDMNKEFDSLPSDIADFKRFNTILCSNEYFGAFYERLKKEYLNARPHKIVVVEEKFKPKQTKSKKSSNLDGCAIAIIIFFLLAGGLGGYNWYKENQKDKIQIAEQERIEKEEQKNKEEQEQKYNQVFFDNISGNFIIEANTAYYGENVIVFEFTNLTSETLNNVILKIIDKNNNELKVFTEYEIYKNDKWKIGQNHYDNWQWRQGQKAKLIFENGITKEFVCPNLVSEDVTTENLNNYVTGGR